MNIQEERGSSAVNWIDWVQYLDASIGEYHYGARSSDNVSGSKVFTESRSEYKVLMQMTVHACMM